MFSKVIIVTQIIITILQIYEGYHFIKGKKEPFNGYFRENGLFYVLLGTALIILETTIRSLN